MSSILTRDQYPTLSLESYRYDKNSQIAVPSIAFLLIRKSSLILHLKCLFYHHSQNLHVMHVNKNRFISVIAIFFINFMSWHSDHQCLLLPVINVSPLLDSMRGDNIRRKRWCWIPQKRRNLHISCNLISSDKYYNIHVRWKCKLNCSHDLKSRVRNENGKYIHTWDDNLSISSFATSQT